jgi:hypothetical protein
VSRAADVLRPGVKRGFLVGGLACVLAACEHGITIRGSVTVPAESQQGLSAEAPGVVVVSGSIPKSSGFSYRLGVICEASSTPLVLPLLHDGFGCAKEGVVRAALVRPLPGESVACGVGQAPWNGPLAPAEANGSAAVFEGQGDGFGCSSGEDVVAIVLAPSR